MNKTMTTMTIVMIGLVSQYAYAEEIPNWIKSNAKWWSEDQISDTDFVSGLEFLIQEDLLKVPPVDSSQQTSNQIPDWIKQNAGWWADGAITDDDFLSGVQYLMEIGMIRVTDSEQVSESKSVADSEINSLQAELAECKEIKKAYERIKCEEKVEEKITLQEYKTNAEPFVVGPITFYYPGAQLETSQSGQANLYITILAENTGSDDNVSLMCSGPAVCNYDVWNGQKSFKYSSTDFTSGQISLKPGDSREIKFLFGPNIGYGGTTFEYDSTKDYYLRISESWGKTNIPLNLE